MLLPITVRHHASLKVTIFKVIVRKKMYNMQLIIFTWKYNILSTLHFILDHCLREISVVLIFDGEHNIGHEHVGLGS